MKKLKLVQLKLKYLVISTKQFVGEGYTSFTFLYPHKTLFTIILEYDKVQLLRATTHQTGKKKSLQRVKGKCEQYVLYTKALFLEKYHGGSKQKERKKMRNVIF